MIEILSQHYGPHSIQPFWMHGVWVITDQGYRELLSGVGNEFNIPCLHGHMPYGIHEYLKGDTTYLTMLRKPVERIVSLYYYVISLGGHGRLWWVDRGVKIGISLPEFVKLPLCHLENSMTRQMAGLPFRHERAKKEVSANEYALASHHLKEFGAIGITENFNQSVKRFGKALGWKQKSRIVHENGRQYDPQVVSRVAKTILERNKWDLELWMQAAQKY